MPDKIRLLLESILQESRASKQEILNIKKDMITHEEFISHTEVMSSRLNDINVQQDQQQKIITELDSRLPQN